RADERGDFNHRQVRGAQAVHERDLVGGGHGRGFVLQPVARPDLDDRDLHESSTSTASGCTSSPSWQCTAVTVASAGERMASSIFMASRITTVSPFLTVVPGRTRTLTTVAGIGAVSA